MQTDFVSVEIRGRLGPPDSLSALGGLTRPAHLRIESSTGTFSARVNGNIDLDFGANEPAFFEEAEYWFAVESRVSGRTPTVIQRDKSVIARRDELPALGIATLTVVYRRQVGLSEWRFRVGDDELLIVIEVFPTKLDYELDYEALVADVTGVKRTLALEYFRATHRLGSIDGSRVGEPLEWITILRRQIADLAQAIQQVNRSPHRGLRTERQLTRLHQVRRATASVVRAVSRGEGSGGLVDVPGIGPVRSWLPIERTNDTLDTFEHRWLRSRLRFVHGRLLALGSEQDARISRTAKSSGREKLPQRLIAEREEISGMTLVIEQLLRLPVIEAATIDVPSSLSSLQLQGATGYSEAYRILTALASALGASPEETPYSLSDVNDLYEVWCFLKVIQVAAQVTGAEVDLSDAVALSASGLRFNLVQGQQSSVMLRWADVSLSLVYNETYRMPTGIQRPDIMLHIRRGSEPEQIIALDAKYRVDASTKYAAQFGSPGAPIDAVNALHRYRDAIRPVIDGNRQQVVVAGAALFPWQKPLGPNDYALRRSLDEVGIGALPLLPGNEDGLTQWLEQFLTESSASSSA